MLPLCQFWWWLKLSRVQEGQKSTKKGIFGLSLFSSPFVCTKQSFKNFTPLIAWLYVLHMCSASQYQIPNDLTDPPQLYGFVEFFSKKMFMWYHLFKDYGIFSCHVRSRHICAKFGAYSKRLWVSKRLFNDRFSKKVPFSNSISPFSN